MYGFEYDGLERLTGARQYVASGLDWINAVNHYTESGIGYDKGGNILTLQRSAGGFLVDNLSYTYDGNRLSALNESVSSAGAGDILVRGGSAQGTYNYDHNGSRTYDSRKNLTYGYNFLNLVDVVKQGQTVKATYKWSASGAKLGVRDSAGSNGFDYAGSVVYSRNGQVTDVDAIHFSHGVIRRQANGYMVNYFLRDHLGSTRVVVDGNGAVLEQNDYYPFGAGHKRGDYPGSDNRYKYNGKEEQVIGDIGSIDYGARFYDPVIGRWNVIDPLAELDRVTTPYAYVFNNPLTFIDPTGMKGESTHTDEFGNIVAVYNDGDKGVYKHDGNRKETSKELKESYNKKNTSGGGEKMGETEFIDEFVSPETGKALTETKIQFGKSFDPIVKRMNEKTKGMDLREIASESRGGGDLDLKKNYTNVGGLLNGKYATSRSAGNFLAGLNAAGGTYFGKGIEFNTFQRLAGALHVVESQGGTLSNYAKAKIAVGNLSYGPPPAYGEVMYQYRMSKLGWDNAKSVK